MENTQPPTDNEMSEIMYLRLTAAEVEAIKRLAKANVRSAAAEMRVAVRQYIETNLQAEKA